MRKSALVIFGLVVAAIVALGLVILATASEANAVKLHHGDAYFFMKRQFVYAAIGVIVAVVVASIDYHVWRDRPWITWTFGAIVFLLLLAVFPPFGRMINGSYRWINFGPVNLQPSEFAKLATVLLLSVCLDRAGWRVELFKQGALGPMAILAVLALPVMLEPDFGSTMVVGLSGIVIMIIAGVRLMHMLPFVGIGAIAFIYRVATNANRMARLSSFFGIKTEEGGVEVMSESAKRALYQVNQALVAIGNGGYTGVGLNQSMQKQYYLPEAHTDFIFAIGAEELGLGFSIGTMALFMFFFGFSVYIAYRAADRLGRFLAMGMSFIIFFQAMFNIGVVCKALPTKGMALPFFSYGGTNMLSAFFAVGIIFSVGIHAANGGRKRRKGHHG